MMPLTEIDRLKQTVSEDWESAVADQVAAAWGHPSGTARWWRSSASHVFVLPGDGARRYLRFVPDSYRGPAHVAAVAELMARLHDAGAAVVRPVPAASGALTVTVPTGLGLMHAMVLEPAAGEEIDVTDLTERRARHWGRALARLHDDSAGLGAGLPTAFGELADVPALFAGDHALVEAVAQLTERLDRLPRDGDRWGVVHGDFELDNMAWSGDDSTAYDFDEAALSWYGADIAYALRDLTGPTGRPSPEQRPHYEAFLAGYRSVRPLADEDIAHLPLFAGLNAAASLVRLGRALADPAAVPNEPQWLAQLRADLAEMTGAHRALVLATARYCASAPGMRLASS